MWDAQHSAAVSFAADPIIATPDVTELNLTPEDEFIVVATDGLWDTMTSKQVVQCVRGEFQKGQSPQQVTDTLTERAIRRYTQDNVAIVVIQLRPPAPRRAPKPAAAGKKKKAWWPGG